MQLNGAGVLKAMRNQLSVWVMTGLMTALLATGCASKPYPVPGRQQITYRDQDSWKIYGNLYEARSTKTGAVILLHQRNGTASDWDPLIPSLKRAGITVLAIDQRGAGSSVGPENGMDAPWNTELDIAGAIRYLEDHVHIKAGRIGLCGASYGANNALRYAARTKNIPAVALLSPGVDYHGLTVSSASTEYKGPLLIISSRDDPIPEGGPQLINHLAKGPHKMLLYEGSRHGTDILARYPAACNEISRFFSEHLVFGKR